MHSFSWHDNWQLTSSSLPILNSDATTATKQSKTIMEEFANTFETEAKIQSNEDKFDPFGIGEETGSNANGVAPTEGEAEDSKSVVSAKSAVSSLPPKVVVKFMVEEEVTSTAGKDGSSDVEIEGTVLVS